MRRTYFSIRPARRSFVVVAVVVVLAMAMTLFALWAQAAVREHRWLDGQALRIEAIRLAEAGLARAEFRHAQDPQYIEETWSIPAADLRGKHAAEVRIRVERLGAALRFTATADFPAGTVRRARVTKQIEITNPATGDES
jgi:hypothetical protein